MNASKKIILGASNGLAKGGWLIIEHHYDQSEKIINFMKNIGMEEVSFEKDLSGIKRYAICRKNKMSTDQFEISDLASKLKKGSLALFPTDTLPALCAYPKFSKKIWTIKKRPSNKPLILMGGCLDDLFEFVKPCALKMA